MMVYLLILLALLVGSAFASQTAINAQLRAHIGNPFLAALVSFFVGTVVLSLYAAITRPEISTEQIGRAPWWVWMGGFLGAFNVAVSIILIPRLGALALVSLIVTGQILASLLLDHFGLIGLSVREMSPARVIGALLVIGGVILIVRN